MSKEEHLEPKGKLSINIDSTEYTPLEIRDNIGERIVTIHKEYSKLTKEDKSKNIYFLVEWCASELTKLNQNKDE